MESLEYLDIADNVYTTRLPASISSLPSLKFFYFDNVLFVPGGQTMEFMVGMPSIEECWMDFTELSGSMPTELGTLTTLVSLSVTFCGLVGPIPSELGNLEMLDRMWIYQNQFRGTIPTELANPERIMILQFEGNELSGTMPAEICAKRTPLGLLGTLGADCQGTGTVTSVECDCCTCCGGAACGDFNFNR